MQEYIQSVTRSVTDAENGIVQGGTESPKEGIPRGKSGSGGRFRTYEHSVDSVCIDKTNRLAAQALAGRLHVGRRIPRPR